MEVNVNHGPKGPDKTISLKSPATGFAIIPPVSAIVGEGFALIGGAEQRGAFRVKIIYFHT